MYRKILQFYRKNPDFTHYTLCAATLGLGVALAGLILGIFSPYAGEIVQNFFIRLSFWINMALGVGALLCFAAVLVWNFGKGVVITTPDVAGMLAASNWVEPLIGRDTLVVLRPGESEEAFYNRQLAAKANAETAFWAVVIPFQKPFGMVYRGGTDHAEFDRANPVFNAGLPPENKLPEGIYFNEETRDNYEKYVEWFCYHFREWASKTKVIAETSAGARMEIFDSLIKPSVNILLCVLLALPVFGQNAAAVNHILGKNAGAIPAEGAQIEFMFERGKSFFRTGNGKSTFIQLLEIPGFAYSKAAPVAVIVNERILGRANGAGEVSAAPNTQAAAMRPISAIPADRVAPGAGWQMPDSLSSAQMAEDTKYQIWRATDAAGKGIKPWWDVVMFTLWQVFPFLIILGALSWLFAGVCAREGMYTLHKHARRVLAIDALSVAGVLLVNFLLMAVGMGFGPFALSLIAAGETYAAYVLVTWLIPDFRPAPGNEPRGRAAYFDQSRQLPG